LRDFIRGVVTGRLGFNDGILRRTGLRGHREELLIGDGLGRLLTPRKGTAAASFAPLLHAVLEINVDEVRGVLLFEKNDAEDAERHIRSS
jgi:hypothetical protein